MLSREFTFIKERTHAGVEDSICRLRLFVYYCQRSPCNIIQLLDKEGVEYESCACLVFYNSFIFTGSH